MERRRPTPAEARNGWTEESLKKYFDEREAQAYLRISGLDKTNRVVVVENTRDYDPNDWRK